MPSCVSPAIELPKRSMKKALAHLPELDSLRAFAVTLTLMAHWSPIKIPYAWYGVDIFFTISGFLITTILITSYNPGQPENRVSIIKRFMMRRTLRLFPLYYLFLMVFWLARRYLHLYLWQPVFTPYFFTYTPNFLFYKIGLEHGSCFSHLWSLGVEEQFYLVWPWIVLYTPSKYRMAIISLIIALSLSLHFVCYTYGIRLLPFGNLHTLGGGALLACFYTNRSRIIALLKLHCNSLFYCTLVHLIVVLLLFNKESAFWHLYREMSLCICTFSIVLVSVYGWKGIVGIIARSKQVQYIGTISYGIYLFHMPIPSLFRLLFSKLHLAFQVPDLVSILVYVVSTIALASLSYKFIETPFLKVKRLYS